MNPHLWTQIEDSLGDALQLPPHERLPFLQSRLAHLPDALQAAQRLLLHAPAAENLFAHSPLDAWRLSPGATLGPWQLERPLGSGGMGAVWLARRIDGQADMRAAIKILPPALAGSLEADSSLRRRFLAEKHILAQLDHPNIARLLDAGAGSNDTPNFVMEFVDGIPLSQYAAQPLSRLQRLTLFAKICHAVEYAHSKLIVHRDIKPQNILIQPNGEPKLLDFGLARLLNDHPTDGSLTLFRAFSLDYASPEQLRAEPISTASDIYSLALVLFEFFTASRPRDWSHLTLIEAAHAASSFQLPPHPSLDPDLLAVLRHATHPDPALRYRSVSDFAADIHRLRLNLPVHARPPRPTERALRFLRRHWIAAAASTSILLIIAASSFSALSSARRASLSQSLAEQRVRDLLVIFNTTLQHTRNNIVNLPGGTKPGYQLISQALADIEKLSPSPQLLPSFLHLRASAHALLRDLAAGPNNSLGDQSAYNRHAAASVDLWRQLHLLEPDDFPARLNLLQAQFVLDRANLAPDSPAWNDWQQRFTQLTTLAPNNPESHSRLAAFHFWAATREGRGTTFAHHLDASIQHNQRALSLDPNNPTISRDLAISHKYRANDRSLPRDKARFHATEALRLDRLRAAAQPGNANARLDLAFSLNSVADVEYYFKNYAAAQPLYRESLLLRQSLLRADPENTHIARSLRYPAFYWAVTSHSLSDFPSLRQALAALDSLPPSAAATLSPTDQAYIRQYRARLASTPPKP